jgi:hypothetical protein
MSTTASAEDPTVYDKSKWHLEGDWPEELAEEQAYVNLGFFLAWMIDHNLVGGILVSDFQEDLEKYKQNEISGPKLLEIIDGTLSSELFTEDGNSFARYYYEDLYLVDLEDTFPEGDSLYEIKDSKENYEKISRRISLAFETWTRKTKKG